MKISKRFDLENDGLNMAVQGQSLYVRCKRDIYKYDATHMTQTARNAIFKKDGKARTVSACDRYVFLTDFCDLHILSAEDLRTLARVRLGEDVSSDLGTVRFDEEKAYICIRNGTVAVMDMETKETVKHAVSGSSFWDHCVVGNRLYAGTVQGELLEVDTGDMRVTRKTALGKKNIYSVVWSGGSLYTVSQDMTIKATSADSFALTATAKKAVKGMARILGLHNNRLVVADSMKISLWEIPTLRFADAFDFPTGAYNKGAALCWDTLIGSDFHSVYSAALG